MSVNRLLPFSLNSVCCFANSSLCNPLETFEAIAQIQNPQQNRENKGLKSFVNQQISLFIFPVATSVFLAAASAFTFGCFAHPVAASAFLAAASVFTFGCFAYPVAASVFPVATSAFTFGCFAYSVAASAFTFRCFAYPVAASAFTFRCFAQPVAASAFNITVRNCIEYRPNKNSPFSSRVGE